MTERLHRIFLWPKASQVPPQARAGLHKPDPLLERVEELVGRRKAWAPIGGATRRTEPAEKLKEWLSDQARHADRVVQTKAVGRTARLRLSDFPRDDNGKRTISTATRIVYLVDETRDFLDCYGAAFGDPAPLATILDVAKGVLLYVTNSVESSGRAFSGDPFTGQVTAYAKIFATDISNVRTHNAVLYYPHQLYSQIFELTGRVRDNKGVKMLHRLGDALVFAGGIIVNPKDWSVLS